MVFHKMLGPHHFFLILLFTYAGCIPCQEEGNIPYVIDNQVGAYSESPSIIAQIVADWLAPENLLQLRQMSSRAHSLGRPQATYDIVCDLAGM
jgi:1,2-diacylglycerol 3-beta-galactosyltransferase